MSCSEEKSLEGNLNFFFFFFLVIKLLKRAVKISDKMHWKIRPT